MNPSNDMSYNQAIVGACSDRQAPMANHLFTSKNFQRNDKKFPTGGSLSAAGSDGQRACVSVTS